MLNLTSKNSKPLSQIKEFKLKKESKFLTFKYLKIEKTKYQAHYQITISETVVRIPTMISNKCSYSQ